MLRNLALIFLTASTVHAHAFVNAINGANGLTAVGLGVSAYLCRRCLQVFG
jgi:hypothetical protein